MSMTTNDDSSGAGAQQEQTAGQAPFHTSAVTSPTVFADGCVFAARMGSTVRLTFAETILEPDGIGPPGLKNRHVGTLVMPIEGFDNMMRYLNDLVARISFSEEV